MARKKSSLVLSGKVKGDPASKLDKIAQEVARGNQLMQREVGKTNTRLTSLDKTAKKFSSVTGNILTGALRRVGHTATDLMARGLREAGAAAIQAGKDSMEFAEAVAEVNTLLDAGMETKLRAMSQAALEFSASYRSGATEQVKGFYTAVSAGAEAGADAIDVMTEANKLSVGGLATVEQSIDGLTTILNAYALDAKFASLVTNNLFVAMKKGKTTIPELVSSIGVLAPTANKVGLSMEAMLAGVAAITTQGIDTRKATVSLNQALTKVIKPTKDALVTAEELGIEFNAAAIRAQGFANWLGEVEEKTRGNDIAIGKLFGNVRGMRAVFALASEQGARKFSEALDEMSNNLTAANDAVSKMSKTTSFQLDRLQNLTESFGIFGATAITESDAVGGAITGINDVLAETLALMASNNEAVGDNREFWIQWGRTVAVDAGKATAHFLLGLSRLVGAFGWLESAMGSVNDLFGGFDRLLAITNPLLLGQADAIKSVAGDLLEWADATAPIETESVKLAATLEKNAHDLQQYIGEVEEKIAQGELEAESTLEVKSAHQQLREELDQLMGARNAHLNRLREQTRQTDAATESERRLKEIAEQRAKSEEDATTKFKRGKLGGAFGGFDLTGATPTNQEFELQRMRDRTASTIKNQEQARQAELARKQEQANRRLERQQELIESSQENAQRYTSTLVSGLGLAAVKGDNLGDALSNIAEQLASKVVQQFVFGLLSGGTFGGPAGGLFGLLGFSKGGVVPGSGNTDSVPALLTPNERVLTVEENQAFERLIDSLSGMQAGGGSARGGANNISATLNATVNSAGGMNDQDIDRLLVDRIMPRFAQLTGLGAGKNSLRG